MRVCIFLTFVLFVVACSKEKNAVEPEKPITKTVTYHVFTQKDYAGAEYNDVNVELRLQIIKINYRTGETAKVWDTTFMQRNIRSFPMEAQKLIVEKTFPVLDSKEKLNGGFSIKYMEKQLVWQEGQSEEAVPGVTNILLEAIL